MPVVFGAIYQRQKLVQAGKQVLNLASCNSTGLAGNETIKMHAIETLRKYGIGNCEPPGSYGTIGVSVYSQSPAVMNSFFADVHVDLERDILADFLGTESSIFYSQGSSKIPCVILAFEKRGELSPTGALILIS